jgi:hypothetical protein
MGGGGGGRGGGTSKDFKKLDHKTQSNMKIEDPLPNFLTTPITPQKEIENDCMSIDKSKCYFTVIKM